MQDTKGWLGYAISGAGRQFWVAFGGNLTGNLVRCSMETNSIASEELPQPLQCQDGTLAFVEMPTSHTWLSGGRDGALRAAGLRASSSGETGCNKYWHAHPALLRHQYFARLRCRCTFAEGHASPYNETTPKAHDVPFLAHVNACACTNCMSYRLFEGDVTQAACCAQVLGLGQHGMALP